jgi:tetratricopeptide (TPR) repeat protein
MLVALAESLADQDRFDNALRLAQQARLLHHEVGDRHGEAYAWFVAAEIHRIRRQLTDATDELRQSWRLYSALDDDQGRAWVLHGLGTVHRLQGRLDEAAAFLAQALAASRRGGDRRVEALVLEGLGLLHRTLSPSAIRSSTRSSHSGKAPTPCGQPRQVRCTSRQCRHLGKPPSWRASRSCGSRKCGTGMSMLPPRNSQDLWIGVSRDLSLTS